MKGPKKFSAPSPEELATAFQIVRGMLDSVELDWPQNTPQELILKHKTLKVLMGAMLHPKMLKGAAKGAKRNREADLAVIADIPKFGSLPKAVRGHMANGKLSRTTTERAHCDRIRLFKKYAI